MVVPVQQEPPTQEVLAVVQVAMDHPQKQHLAILDLEVLGAMVEQYTVEEVLVIQAVQAVQTIYHLEEEKVKMALVVS
jgi:hypothetical protein